MADGYGIEPYRLSPASRFPSGPEPSPDNHPILELLIGIEPTDFGFEGLSRPSGRSIFVDFGQGSFYVLNDVIDHIENSIHVLLI